MDGAKEVAGCLVIARGNAAVQLESGKEILDQIPSLV